jgi:ubiquinone/menaquinone biosynthesis C-methylase UbiE
MGRAEGGRQKQASAKGVVVAVVALLYWELIIVEGAHLGTRVVVALYDLAAPRYERIKRFDAQVEADTLGWPLAAALAHVEAPRVLDVACGTGRVARAVLPQPAFDGHLVNADLSARMLRHGRPQCAAWPGRLDWVRAPAANLPFAAASFDAVTCLEALEFMPDAPAALAECARVLRPGGLLLVTNRVGRDAWLLAGKTFTRPRFARLLAELPLGEVSVQRWQVEYDLAWGWKTG